MTIRALTANAVGQTVQLEVAGSGTLSNYSVLLPDLAQVQTLTYTAGSYPGEVQVQGYIR